MSQAIMRAAAVAFMLAGAFGAIATPAAAQRAGTATDVNATARVQDAAGTALRFLETRGDVFIGDHISTDRSGQAQILFADDTRMVVGPNAQITIDRYVFNSASTASEVVIDTVRGAFRFITGHSNKDAYLIRFPTGTIGVRGTELDIVVEDDRTTKISLWDGGIVVCDDRQPRTCREVNDRCSLLIVHPDRQQEIVRNVYERTDILDRDFPYAFAQQRIDRPYWVSSSGCEMRDYTGEPSESRDRDRRQEEQEQQSAPPDEPGDGDGEGDGGDGGVIIG